MRNIVFTLFFLIISCSSQRFEKMTSVDDVLENYEASNHKGDDQFITKRGSVVSMHIEEVRDQKQRLEKQLSDRDKQIEYLNEVITDLKKDMMQLRLRMGLTAEKPAAHGKCCDSRGYLIPGSYQPTPTIDQELSLAPQ